MCVQQLACHISGRKSGEAVVTSFGGDFHAPFFHDRLILRIDEELLGDGHSYSPRAIHSWLTRAMYSRRSKMNPLWNTVVIGGHSDGERLT